MNHFNEKEYFFDILIISVLGLMVFVPFIGYSQLFDWDEINFAESAREMLVSNNYLDVQINFISFWEKPPLFFWIQSLSMYFFGVNEFAARLPNALVGVFTALTLYKIGRKLLDRESAILWILIFSGSFLPFLYFKSGIIDPLFNLFIFLSVYQFYQYTYHKKLIAVLYSAMFIGLATLTKGPVALLILLLTAFCYFIFKPKLFRLIRLKALLIFILTFSFFGGFWFILQFLNGNSQILIDFVVYMIRLMKEKDAGHGGFLGYHFVVLFFGVFPASVFALDAILKIRKDERQKDFKVLMFILFWVVLILFSIVNTKIVHYSSLCYLPMSYLALTSILSLKDHRLKLWHKLLLSFITFIWGGVIAVIPILAKNKQTLINSLQISDEFALANFQAKVFWPWYILIFGLLYLIIMFLLIWRKHIKNRIILIFLSSMIFIYLVIVTVAPKIAPYSQDAAVSFYKSKVGEDCYLQTYGFKSYAPYFYGKVTNTSNPKSKNIEWVLSDEVDKKVYVVIKNVKQSEFEDLYPSFRLLYSKNGFMFYQKLLPVNVK
jgi:4-amino-4-deoxy-L-arabinose transferase-like glycosyltransferase